MRSFALISVSLGLHSKKKNGENSQFGWQLRLGIILIDVFILTFMVWFWFMGEIKLISISTCNLYYLSVTERNCEITLVSGLLDPCSTRVYSCINSLSQFFKHPLIDIFLLPLGTPMASLLRGKSSWACAGILIHMEDARKAQFVNHLQKMYDA